MVKREVLDKLSVVFNDVFDSADINLTYETTALDVDGWDSITNIELVVAVETEFGIEFTADDIASFQNVGEMCDKILSKLNG